MKIYRMILLVVSIPLLTTQIIADSNQAFKACPSLRSIAHFVDVTAKNIINADIDSTIDLSREEAEMEVLQEAYEHTLSECAVKI